LISDEPNKKEEKHRHKNVTTLFIYFM